LQIGPLIPENQFLEHQLLKHQLLKHQLLKHQLLKHQLLKHQVRNSQSGTWEWNFLAPYAYPELGPSLKSVFVCNANRLQNLARPKVM
jgi:hypothetical protein